LDQYCRTLPGADGRGTNRGPTLNSVLPDELVKLLKGAGPVGEALLRLPAAAPIQALGSEGRSPGVDADALLASGRFGYRTKRPGRDNPIKAAATTVTKGDLGAAFGLMLLVSSLGLAAAAWMRFRKRHPF
jgi:hypothetical protein